MVFKKMQDQKLSLYCCQRTIRNNRIGKTWLWWQLWLAIKPNLKCTKFAQYKVHLRFTFFHRIIHWVLY
jgi:hypothetical protein